MIQEIVNDLNSKYRVLMTEYQQMREQKNEFDTSIDAMKQTLNFPESFDDSDIDELSSMLSSEYQKRLQNIKLYLKVLNKFPNQPQIVKAKTIYEEVKQKLIEVINEENSDFYQAFDELKDRIKFFENIINDLSKYDNNIYLNPINLYNLIRFLNINDINDDLVNFYEIVLKNNMKLINSIEIDELDDNILNNDLLNFVFRLKNINKSLTNNTLETDMLIYNLFTQMLDNNHEAKFSSVQYSKITSALLDDIENRPILKRIRFLIHLYRVNIDLVPEQIDFIKLIRKGYKESIENNKKYQTIIKKNKRFIDKLNCEEVYTDLDLLNSVFELNNISLLDRLKIISCIMYQNNLCIYKKRDKDKVYKITD